MGLWGWAFSHGRGDPVSVLEARDVAAEERGLEPVEELQGYLAHKKAPAPLGLP